MYLSPAYVNLVMQIGRHRKREPKSPIYLKLNIPKAAVANAGYLLRLRTLPGLGLDAVNFLLTFLHVGLGDLVVHAESVLQFSVFSNTGLISLVVVEELILVFKCGC